ncbi:MAG: PAS domain-containing protein [Alphaproteobacteria bacterium]|nr:PAS domain-containing protein [Alphaproteobacteria bacterium]
MDTRRTADLKETGPSDFIVRDRLPYMWQLVLLFFLCFSVLFLVAVNASSFGGVVGIGLAIFAVIGPLTWFTVYYNQRNRDLVLATEFQNALFSAAARLKSKFCMIVKNDGTVFYYDRAFQQIFPETANRGVLMLDKIFSTKHISAQEAKKLDNALENGHSETIIVQVEDGTGDAQRVIITIDPITRPEGFFILRGRDYVVKKYDRSSSDEAISQQRVQFLDSPEISSTVSHLLQTLPQGLYATDPEGKLLYINYTLESWLGYSQNEILSRQLTLYDLMPQQNTEAAEGLFLRDCEGEVLFTTKERRTLPLLIKQEITRAENGASLGTVAVVEQPSPASNSERKGQSGNAPVAPRSSNPNTF